MRKPTTFIKIRTMVETEDKIFGRKFVERLVSEDPRLVPQLVSLEERFKDPFVDIEHFIENWWAIPVIARRQGDPPYEYFKGPMWKRKSPLAGRGMVNHGMIDIKYRRTPSNFWFESRWAKDVDFTHLFGEWVELSNPEIGMLHVFTDVELDFLSGQEEGMSFEAGSFGGPFKPGIANIGWAMAFGGAYAAEVDVARLREAHFPLKEFGDVIVVQVTEKLSDVVDDFPYFSARRAELKRLFRPSLFWIEDEPTLKVR